VHLVEDNSKNLIDALLEGHVHSAILGVTADLPERLNHWRLFGESYLVAVAQDHPFACLEEIPITALEQTAWLEREECEAHCRLEQLCSDAGSKPRVAHRGRQEDHLQHMAAAGLGALLVPGHVRCLSNVVFRPIEGDPLGRSVELVVVGGRQYSPALDAFVKIVRRHDWQRFAGKATIPSSGVEMPGLRKDLEAACRRGHEIGARSHGSINSILDRGLDCQSLPRPTQPSLRLIQRG
jgi:DNA-binding transcriptional LysR family regulator